MSLRTEENLDGRGEALGLDTGSDEGSTGFNTSATQPSARVSNVYFTTPSQNVAGFSAQAQTSTMGTPGSSGPGVLVLGGVKILKKPNLLAHNPRDTKILPKEDREALKLRDIKSFREIAKDAQGLSTGSIDLNIPDQQAATKPSEVLNVIRIHTKLVDHIET